MVEAQIIGTVEKNGIPLVVVLCPACGCPRFADYACDTCCRRAENAPALVAEVERLRGEIERFEQAEAERRAEEEEREMDAWGDALDRGF